MARIASSNATNVAPLANGERTSVGVKPPTKPRQPCARHVLAKQSSMPLYLRWAGSRASVCSLDLTTSMG